MAKAKANAKANGCEIAQSAVEAVEGATVIITVARAHAEASTLLFDGLGYGRKDFSAVLQLLRGRPTDLG